MRGAAEGAGLGHDFLRHIDRRRLLIHVVDVSGSEGRDPVEDFDKICAELHEYSVDLSNRPMIVATNKCDLLEPDSDNLQRLRDHVAAMGCEFYEISAATTMGARHLMQVVAAKLLELPPITVYEPEYVKPLAQAGDPQELEIDHYGDTGWFPAPGWSGFWETFASMTTNPGTILTASCVNAACSTAWRRWELQTGTRSAFTTGNSPTNGNRTQRGAVPWFRI